MALYSLFTDNANKHVFNGDFLSFFDSFCQNHAIGWAGGAY